MHGSLSKRKSFMEFEHGVLGVEAQSRRSVDRTAFPLSNETEVEESQEENEMDNGAHAANLSVADDVSRILETWKFRQERGRTGSAWVSATDTVVLRSTNSRFSEHHHEPRSRTRFLRFYHLSFKNSLAVGIYARGMGDPRRTLVRPIAAGRDGTLRLLLVRQDDRPGRGGCGMGGPYRILHWLRGV
jgi:hypothetical protein